MSQLVVSPRPELSRLGVRLVAGRGVFVASRSVHHDVLILGASCRAAAFSALRCGLRPHCADYFADRDLAAVCPVVRVDPRRCRQPVRRVAESLPPSPWFYTGGFENHPDWVERIARRHRSGGWTRTSLRAVRDPIAGRRSARTGRDSRPGGAAAIRAGLPRDGSWLVKPLRSGGGRDIRPLADGIDDRFPSPIFRSGSMAPSFSALFVGDRLTARLVGVTQQLIGDRGLSVRLSRKHRALADRRRRGRPAAEAGRRWSRRSASSAGSALTTCFAMAIPGRLRSTLGTRPRSRFTSWPRAGRCWRASSRLRGKLGSRRPTGSEARCPHRPRMVAKLILYAPQRLIAPEIVADDNEP